MKQSKRGKGRRNEERTGREEEYEKKDFANVKIETQEDQGRIIRSAKYNHLTSSPSCRIYQKI